MAKEGLVPDDGNFNLSAPSASKGPGKDDGNVNFNAPSTSKGTKGPLGYDGKSNSPTPEGCWKNAVSLKKNKNDQQPETPIKLIVKKKLDPGILKILQQGQVDVPGSKRRHDSSEGPSQGHNISMRKKIVMKIVHAFNDETCDQDMQVCLDPQTIKETDLDNHNFTGGEERACARGSFGIVFPMTTKQGKKIMVKEFQREKGVKVDHNEIEIPLGLPKKGIVQIVGLKYCKDRLWILMEDAGHSLHWWLTNKEDDRFRRWSQKPENLKDIFYQLFKILQSLERQWIVHRDIKPGNVCVRFEDGKWVLTLVDFGSAQTAQDIERPAAHTTEYLPARLNEIRHCIITGQQCHLEQHIFYHEKCDVWAMALIILTIFNKGFHPISEVEEYDQMKNEKDLLLDKMKEVMQIIMKMTDEFFEPFLSQFEGPLQLALQNSLLVDRNKAWTANQVCCHLEKDGQSVCPKKPRLSADTDKMAPSREEVMKKLKKKVMQKKNQVALKLFTKDTAKSPQKSGSCTGQQDVRHDMETGVVVVVQQDTEDAGLDQQLG